MTTRQLAKTSFSLWTSVFAVVIMTAVRTPTAKGQILPDWAQQQQRPSPSVTMPETRTPSSLATDRDLYCAGYIRFEPFPRTAQIVGAEQEQEKRVFTQGAHVYVDAGSEHGIREAQEFAIVRPRGKLKGVYAQKKNSLGVYVQEIGRLQIVKVLNQVSVAEIVSSCEEVLLGDLLTDVPHRASPIQQAVTPLDRFANPSGKQTGRIVMAREGREMVTRNDIVYIDLGAEDNLNVGNYLTIYRKVGAGNNVNVRKEEMAPGRSGGFQTRQFRGGGFSINATRARETSDGVFKGRPITTTEIKDHRPSLPRKIVGELVILNVQTRTATGIITRVAQDVHTGDFVEVQ
jgi:hypothetical protein